MCKCGFESMYISAFYALFGFPVILCWLVTKVKRLPGVKKKLRYKRNIMYTDFTWVMHLFVSYDPFARKNFKVIGINRKYELQNGVW